MKSEYPLSNFYERANFELLYIYSDGAYTVPVLLTKERADKFAADASVVKIRLTSASFMPLIPGKPSIKQIELDVV